MRSCLKFSVILLVINLLNFTPLKSLAQTNVYVSYQAFYDDLSPYGQWVDEPQYGYVWVPNLDGDFRPYFTNGYWAMTDYGNTWVSGYPWGWACFHYGRWVYTGYYGWVWIPGSEWGPGWVAWRWGMGYCGWAPLYPGVEWGVGVDFICPDDWWIFMHPRHLYRPRYYNYWRDDYWRGPRYTKKILDHSSNVINKFGNDKATYFAGPRAEDVQKVTHEPVTVYHIEQASVREPGTKVGNTIIMYHPDKVEAVNQGGVRAVPANVVHAPQPLGKPVDVQKNWNQPHEFKTNTQKQTPGWDKPFIRNEPPYNPHPNNPVQNNPNPAPNNYRPQNNPAPNVAPQAPRPVQPSRSAPQPRSNPGSAPRHR